MSISSLDDLLCRLFQKDDYSSMGSLGSQSEIYMSKTKVVKIVYLEESAAHIDFVKECACIKATSGPFVMPVYECGIYKNYGYISMPRGVDARDFRPTTEAEFASFMYQLLTSVMHIHERHVVHYDIKPHNVILLNGVKLADFGIAEFFPTMMKTVYPNKVTHGYRPPELARAMSKGHGYIEVSILEAKASDVWATFVTIIDTITSRGFVTILQRIGEDDEKFNMRLLDHIVRPWTLRRNMLTAEANRILSDEMIYRINEMGSLAFQEKWQKRGSAEDLRDVIYRESPVRMGPILNVKHYWDSMDKAIRLIDDMMLTDEEVVAAKVLFVLLMDVHRGNALFRECDLLATSYILASTHVELHDLEKAFGIGTSKKVHALVSYTNGNIIPKAFKKYLAYGMNEESILEALKEDMK